jgi:uncharacterized GH25 family protein
MQRRTVRASFASILLLPAAATAHEYWLLPDRFSAATAEPIAIEHRVGTGWPGEALPRSEARIVRFGIVDALGERPIGGAEGSDPAGTTELRRPGAAFAVYRSRPSAVRLEADAFESYLREEGLEAVSARRAASGESASPGLEIFSRNAKALLGAPGGDPARDAPLLRRPVGLDLELVPETDPRLASAGAPLVLRLLFHGKPLAGALIKAFPQGGNERRVAGRTGADGRVRLALAEPGVWLVSAVHMVDAPADSGARWESLWSSLTFERSDSRR